MSPFALHGLRVLDLSRGIAGPLCARLLGDFGADVVKVEPPEGEPGRRLGPFFQDDPHPEKSLFFLMLNLNKRGITLDLETPEGAGLLRRLVRQADVVVESFKPGYLASLGLGHSSLERDNSGLVMVSITPFGQTGPYREFEGEEIVAYAMSGIMGISGTADREPLKHGGFQSQYEAGMNGALATLFAILQRDATGAGDHVDVSIHEVLTSTMVIGQPMYAFTGAVQGRRRPTGTDFGNVMPCKDGYFIAQTGGGASWDAMADFFGRPELKEPRFADPDQRVAHGEELDRIVADAVSDRTMNEMFKTASEEYRMLLGIVQKPSDLASCPQLEARGFYAEVEHPVIGKVKVPFRLWSMTASEARYGRCAPLLGEHQAEVLRELEAAEASCAGEDAGGTALADANVRPN